MKHSYLNNAAFELLTLFNNNNNNNDNNNNNNNNMVCGVNMRNGCIRTRSTVCRDTPHTR